MEADHTAASKLLADKRNGREDHPASDSASQGSPMPFQADEENAEQAHPS